MGRANLRRRFNAEERLRLIQATEEPGKSIVQVAREQGVPAYLLYKWRQKERQSVEGTKNFVRIASPVVSKGASPISCIHIGSIRMDVTPETDILSLVDFVTQLAEHSNALH